MSARASQVGDYISKCVRESGSLLIMMSLSEHNTMIPVQRFHLRDTIDVLVGLSTKDTHFTPTIHLVNNFEPFCIFCSPTSLEEFTWDYSIIRYFQGEDSLEGTEKIFENNVVRFTVRENNKRVILIKGITLTYQDNLNLADILIRITRSFNLTAQSHSGTARAIFNHIVKKGTKTFQKKGSGALDIFMNNLDKYDTSGTFIFAIFSDSEKLVAIQIYNELVKICYNKIRYSITHAHLC